MTSDYDNPFDDQTVNKMPLFSQFDIPGFDIHRIRKEATKLIDDIPGNVETPDGYDIEEEDKVRVPEDYQDKFGERGTVKTVSSLFAIVLSNQTGEEYLFALDELEKVDEETDENFDVSKTTREEYLDGESEKSGSNNRGPKFNEGDPVRVKENHPHSQMVGRRGTVSSNCLFVGPEVEFENGDCEPVGEQFLELAEKESKNGSVYSVGETVRVVKPTNNNKLSVGEVGEVKRIDLKRTENVGVDIGQIGGLVYFKDDELELVEGKTDYEVDDFEEGERVKIVDGYYDGRQNKGEIVEVNDNREFPIQVDVYFVLGKSRYKPSELEKIEDNESEYTYEDFEEGEKVKVFRDENNTDGIEGEVIGIHPESSYPIKVDPGIFVPAGYKPSELEKVDDGETNNEDLQISIGDEVKINIVGSPFNKRTGKVKVVDPISDHPVGVELSFGHPPNENRIVLFSEDEVEMVEEYNKVLVRTENYNQLKAYLDVGEEFGYSLSESDMTTVEFKQYKSGVNSMEGNFEWILFKSNGDILVRTDRPDQHGRGEGYYENVGLSKLRSLLENN